jgi:hypothetical protein
MGCCLPWLSLLKNGVLCMEFTFALFNINTRGGLLQRKTQIIDKMRRSKEKTEKLLDITESF